MLPLVSRETQAVLPNGPTESRARIWRTGIPTLQQVNDDYKLADEVVQANSSNACRRSPSPPTGIQASTEVTASVSFDATTVLVYR